MTVLARCGDCQAPLSRRAVMMAGLERLMRRHRMQTGCNGSGITVLPQPEKTAKETQ
jgi:hypothetical protein